MANANSIPTEPTVDCSCMRAHHAALEQHQSAVQEWARHIFRERAPAKGGFVSCPPFPVAPSFWSTCAVYCARRTEEAPHA